jgi:hypothetical protein
MKDGFVRRYDTSQTEDGLRGGEGQFLACSFWLVACLCLMGRHGDARKLFERLMGLANDVGLLSEEYDSTRKRLVGNFPKRSHILHYFTLPSLYRASGCRNYHMMRADQIRRKCLKRRMATARRVQPKHLPTDPKPGERQIRHAFAVLEARCAI